MIRRDRQAKSNRFRSGMKERDNDEQIYGPQFGYDRESDEFGNSSLRDSDFRRSEFEFDDRHFGRKADRVRYEEHPQREFASDWRDDWRRGDNKPGRFEGRNRWGEERVRPDMYEDEYGMRRPTSPRDHAQQTWSQDPRSGAFNEGHYGKGPKGYRRTDQSIHEDVCEMLTRHPEIDASTFEVEVSDGIVTLEGTANNRREKRLTEDLIEEVRGVRDVYNHLTTWKGIEGWIPGVGEVEKGEEGGIVKALKNS